MIYNYLKSWFFKVVPRRWHPKILAMWYYGRRVECPCCGGRFRKFLAVGDKVRKRLNVRCAVCGSYNRHRLIWLYLKNRTNLFSDNLKVLHFAPERVFQERFRCLTNLDYVSADLDSAQATLKMDITNMTFEDNTFDVILCSHVLEHVPDDRKAMRELFRVLKPKGWAIIQVPILREKTLEDPTVVSPEDRQQVFGQSDHVRVYGYDFIDRMKKAGFEVKSDKYVKEFEKGLFEKYGLQDIDICFCTK